MRSIPFLLALAAILSGCGTGTSQREEQTVVLTGVTQVLQAGTRSETVVLEVTESGEFYALVGDLARELVAGYGTEVAVTGVPTEEGWSVREDLQKILVIDYSILGEPEYP
jgi:hypothetical protein